MKTIIPTGNKQPLSRAGTSPKIALVPFYFKDGVDFRGYRKRKVNQLNRKPDAGLSFKITFGSREMGQAPDNEIHDLKLGRLQRLLFHGATS